LSKDPESDLDVARDVLRYFVRNPEAADTVEGVARWRLLDERVYCSLQQVTRAMAWLVAQGLLVEDQLPSSRTAFRLNQTALKQIERLLQQEEPRRKSRKKPKKKKR
jgi:hypothetical protein